MITQLLLLSMLIGFEVELSEVFPDTGWHSTGDPIALGIGSDGDTVYAVFSMTEIEQSSYAYTFNESQAIRKNMDLDKYQGSYPEGRRIEKGIAIVFACALVFMIIGGITN